MAKEAYLEIPGLLFRQSKRNPTIDSDACPFELNFYKDQEYFSVLENLNTFVKGVEALCRKSEYYARYVKYIKQDIGLKTCQVLSNIEISEDSKVTIEMHHGPILTLYDYCVIIIDCLLNMDYPHITTYRVADILMREHYLNNIQVVMLSKTVHEAVDEGLFLNYKQGFGDINAFLQKYKKGLDKEQVLKINAYIAMCEQYDSFDNMLLDLQETVRSWAKESVF